MPVVLSSLNSDNDFLWRRSEVSFDLLDCVTFEGGLCPTLYEEDFSMFCYIMISCSQPFFLTFFVLLTVLLSTLESFPFRVADIHFFLQYFEVIFGIYFSPGKYMIDNL